MTRGICWRQVADRFVASRTGCQSCTRALSELHMTSGRKSLKAASRQLADRTLALVTCRREELAMQSSRRSNSITFHLSLPLVDQANLKRFAPFLVRCEAASRPKPPRPRASVTLHAPCRTLSTIACRVVEQLPSWCLRFRPGSFRGRTQEK